MTKAEAAKLGAKVAASLCRDAQGGKSTRVGLVDSSGGIEFLEEKALAKLVAQALSPSVRPRRKDT